MEHNEETALLQVNSQSQPQTCQTLCRVSPTIQDSSDGKFVSLYQGELTKKGVADVTAKVMKAFPGWSKEQSEVLMDRFAENGFTDERMRDAVNHVIDTYEGYGKIPNIANFIQFNKQYRVYTIPEVNALEAKGSHKFQDFAIVRIEGLSACRSAAGKRPLYVLKADADRYGLTTRDPIYAGQEWQD